MDRLWDFVFDKLYCEKTGLIYENITEYKKDGNICNLPTPEQIRHQVPNPCSWGTGMEDSMINAGIMLDAVIDRYEVTGDPRMKEYADKLLKGIDLCSQVHGRQGFLVRSVSPEDCESYYINTSRDQYTHVIYSLVRFIHSGLCTDEQREHFKAVVTAYAKRFADEVTEQNGYQLLRADGKRGLVCRMWNVAPHEALRLPMFYLSGYVCSGDRKYLELYKQYRDEGIARTLEKQTAIDTNILLQTQYSVRLLYDHDPEYREKYSKVLRFNANRARKYLVENIGQYNSTNVNVLAARWSDCDMRYEWGHILVEGYDYPIPTEPVRAFTSPLRFLGSAITTVALADMQVPEQQLEQLNVIKQLIDCDKHAAILPVHILSAYWSNENLKLKNI